MRVYVREADIAASNRTGPEGPCPIELALKRKFPGEPVIVGATVAQVGDQEYALGASGRWFVRMFDSGDGAIPMPVTLLPRERVIL